MPPTRKCKKCETEKPLEHFQVHTPQTGGRRWECNECCRSRYSDYYQESTDRYNAKAKRYYERLRKDPARYNKRIKRKLELDKLRNTKMRGVVLDHYGRACACCGEDEERFLTIDHVNSDGKEMRKVHRTGLSFYRWLKNNDWPAEFQTLCFNCNLGRALNNGICPHQKGSTTIPRGSRTKRSEAPSPRNGVKI
jgi:hypothetical protein